MRHTIRIYAIAALISLAAAAACPGVSDARKLTDRTVIANLEYGYQNGLITEKAPGGDYFKVQGNTIFLVEYAVSGQTLVTAFHGLGGEDITFADLKVGDYVYVYGGALKDDTRAAQDVFVTKGKMTPKERKAFFKEKKVAPWNKDRK